MPEPRSRTQLLASVADAPVRLADVAPRLAAARDEFLTSRLNQRAEIRYLERAILSLERCVAHRELQLVRAMATGSGSYITRRQTKLDRARRELARRRRQRARIDDQVLLLVPAERKATC